MTGFGQGKVEEVMGGLVRSLTSVADIFEGLGGSIGKFVEAISPGTVQLFNLAMRDLYATIGSALMPVMQALTDGVRRAAALLVPALDSLRPAFQTLSQALLSFIMPAIQATSHALKASGESMQKIGNVLKAFGDTLAVVSVIFISIKDVLSTTFGEGGLFTSIINWTINALRQLGLTLLKVSAMIANSLGNTDFTNKLIANLNELANPKKGGIGAGAHNFQSQGFEQIAHDIALAAATAAGPGAGEKEDPLVGFAKDAIAELKNIQDKGLTFGDLMKATIEDLKKEFRILFDELAEKIGNKLKFWK